MWGYADARHALRDALRLSRAMTYKSAVADLPLGGGKGVIMLPSGAQISFHPQGAGDRQHIVGRRIVHGPAAPKRARPEILERPAIEAGKIVRLCWFCAHGT